MQEVYHGDLILKEVLHVVEAVLCDFYRRRSADLPYALVGEYLVFLAPVVFIPEPEGNNEGLFPVRGEADAGDLLRARLDIESEILFAAKSFSPELHIAPSRFDVDFPVDKICER